MPRAVALDAFRGMTIAAMILVNTPGSWSYVYAPLRHAAWHGCTPTDLVFPFFLFVVGAAMWFSFGKYERRLSGPVLAKVAKRAALLVVIGIGLGAFPFLKPPSEWRLPGVLQRIGLAYGLAAVLCLTLPRQALAAAVAALLLGYWALLVAFGGADPYGLETNAVRALDLAVFGEAHVYRGFGVPFDPEGLLSTLPAVGTVLLGYLAGPWLGDADRLRGLRGLVGVGAALTVGGLLWHLAWPINKPLWTGSYVLYTGGLAMLGLAVFVWVLDVRGVRRGLTPLLIFGLNPLLAYLLSGLWARILTRLVVLPTPDGGTVTGYTWLYDHLFVPVAGPMNGSLLFALTHVALLGLLLWPLYRRGIVVKL